MNLVGYLSASSSPWKLIFMPAAFTPSHTPQLSHLLYHILHLSHPFFVLHCSYTPLNITTSLQNYPNLIPQCHSFFTFTPFLYLAILTSFFIQCGGVVGVGGDGVMAAGGGTAAGVEWQWRGAASGRDSAGGCGWGPPAPTHLQDAQDHLHHPPLPPHWVSNKKHQFFTQVFRSIIQSISECS